MGMYDTFVTAEYPDGIQSKKFECCLTTFKIGERVSRLSENLFVKENNYHPDGKSNVWIIIEQGIFIGIVESIEKANNYVLNRYREEW